MDFLNELEARLPVAAWRVGELHVWPLVRLGLISLLLGTGGGAAPRRRLSAAREIAGSWLGAMSATLRDPHHAADPRGAVKAVFLGDGLSFIRVRGAYYDRFCDPLIARLRERGVASLSLQHGPHYRVPRATPSYYVEPGLQALRLRMRLLPPELPTGIHLPGFASYAAAVAHLPGALRDETALARRVVAIEAASAFFMKLLRRARPNVAVVVCYYSPVALAYVLSCTRLGIPTIDLQHGIQGDLHPAYGRWSRVPAGGYELLPSHFWCWGEAEAEAIDRWRGATPRHRPLVGGNPLLEGWSEIYPDARADRACLDATCPVPPGGGRLLVTLPPHPSEEEIGKWLDLVDRLGPRWFWHLRCHPGRSELAVAIDARLAAAGLLNAEARRATEFPLYSLLGAIDVHLTAFSSVVIEAKTLGIPSVIVHPLGAELFGASMATGGISYVPDPDGVADELDRLLARPHAPGAAHPATAAGFEALLALTCGQPS